MTCGFISKQFGSCCFVSLAVVFGQGACHVLKPATARCRACSRFVVVVLHVGLESVSVCLWYVIYQRNARQSDDALPIGLPQSDYLAHHSIMFTSRLGALSIAFRVAGFGRADLTALPLVIQPRCDSLRSMSLNLIVLGNSLAHFLPCQSQQIGHLLCLHLCNPLGLKPI